jgi:ubiquinone/menaquinone biosynthesis C-methylase UbiE
MEDAMTAVISSALPSGVDPADVIDRPVAYEHLATAYDRRTTAYQSVRDKIAAALPLRPGDRVLDVGCGTGLSFTALQSGVGPTGEVIGIDEAPAMTTLAGVRSARNGWDNVTLLAASAESATIDGAADAALICTAHDVLQSTVALQNVVGQLRPGAWVVAGGGKFAAPWMVGLNLWVAENHRPYVRSFEGFDKPWRHLERFVDELVVEELAFGTAYRAIGRVRT